MREPPSTPVVAYADDCAAVRAALRELGGCEDLDQALARIKCMPDGMKKLRSRLPVELQVREARRGGWSGVGRRWVAARMHAQSSPQSAVSVGGAVCCTER